MIDNFSMLFTMLFLGRKKNFNSRLKYLLVLWELVHNFALGDVKLKCNL